MTWTKLSDDFSDDCWQLSDAAFRLHVEGLIWSNRKLLDLVLPKDEVQRWAKNPAVAEELVNRGWWEDRGDHYYIVHHGGYQRLAQAVLHQQKVNQANRSRRGKAVKPTREQVSDIKPNDSSHDSFNDSSNEMDGTGRDGPGQEEGTNNVAELPLAAGAESWPPWQGQGPNPFHEHN